MSLSTCGTFILSYLQGLNDRLRKEFPSDCYRSGSSASATAVFLDYRSSHGF